MRKIIASILFIIYISLISGVELKDDGITLLNATDELYLNIDLIIPQENIDYGYYIDDNIIEEYNPLVISLFSEKIVNQNINFIADYFMPAIYRLKNHTPTNYYLSYGLYEITTSVDLHGWHQDPTYINKPDHDIRFIMFADDSINTRLTQFSRGSRDIMPNRDTIPIHSLLLDYPIEYRTMYMGADLNQINIPNIKDNKRIIIGFDNYRVLHRTPKIFEKIIQNRRIYSFQFNWYDKDQYIP